MYKRRINTRGIIYSNGQLFCQQLLKTSQSDNPYWSTPGGGLDDGESLTDGLRREMIEETGIAPVIGRLLFVQQFHDQTQEHLEFFFHITNADDYKTIDLGASSHGEIEVANCGFIDPTTANLLPSFLQTVDLAASIKGDQPVLVSSELA